MDLYYLLTLSYEFTRRPPISAPNRAISPTPLVPTTLPSSTGPIATHLCARPSLSAQATAPVLPISQSSPRLQRVFAQERHQSSPLPLPR